MTSHTAARRTRTKPKPGVESRTVVKLSGTMRPIQTETINAEGDSYESARAALEAQVPEGWQLLQVLTER